MTNIILNGCCGKMGKVIAAAAKKRDNVEIICGVDTYNDNACSFPVYKCINDIDENIVKKANCLIDFSLPCAFDGVIDFCVSKKLPCVIATTGLSAEQKKKISAAADIIPVFYTANMSIGVNLLCELAKIAAKALGDDFDIEIVEMHHNQKVDAPSGTALMIADEVNSVLNDKMEYEYNRHEKREKRNKNEIGIHSLRGGNVVGEHEIIFAGGSEVIKLSHSAQDKGLFAKGALDGALLISESEPGLYSMKNLLSKIM